MNLFHINSHLINKCIRKSCISLHQKSNAFPIITKKKNNNNKKKKDGHIKFKDIPVELRINCKIYIYNTSISTENEIAFTLHDCSF